MRYLILAACLVCPAVSSAEALKPGTNRVVLKHDGRERDMLIRLPRNYDSSRRHPVIFGFHGANGPMEGYHRQLESLVDKEGVISVSPQGVSNARGVTGWNGFEGHRISNTDDVGLVRKIVAYLKEHATVDTNRIYATGGSSGAIFCYRLVLETDILAAIAPMRGGLIKKLPVPKDRPRLSILLVCGTEDALYKGGTCGPDEVFYSAHEAMALWATNHGARAEPEVVDRSDGIVLTRFSPPDAAYELLLYAVDGKGHKLGRDIMENAQAYMWEFFKRHTKPKGKTHPQHLALERTEATDAGPPSAGADNPPVKPASKKNGSIDVVAAGPRFETEPVELNPNAGLEADTRQKDYALRRLPTNAPLAELNFVSPGAGGSRHAAKITAREGQGGMLICTVPVDKGEAMTFSARIRAEGIRSVSLAVVASSSRFGGARQPLGPGRFGRGPRGRKAQGPDARSKALRGTFDWTTLSLDTSLVQNIDQASVQVVVHGPGTVWVDDISVKTHWPKRVEVPGKPAAPLYVMALMHSETPQAYIHSRDFFRADATKYEEMAKMLKRYGARLVAQPERELWLGAKKHDPDFIRRLHEEYGVSFSVHTHGPNPRSKPTVQDVLNYVKVRKEEMEALGAGLVTDLNGNFDQKDWDVFAKIGIRTMTAYKNVRTQMGQMAMKHSYRHPWRPAGSPYQGEQQWARHRPESGVVYLPGAGAIHTRHHDRFADLMERHLRAALRRVRADRINVFYFVEHVGRFQPTASGQSPLKYVSSKAFRDDLAQHEKLYRDVLAPLVKSGHVRYAVPGEVCDLFEDWERKMGIGRQK